MTAALAAVIGPGCMGDPVVMGHIPPSTFQFTTVVEHDGHGPGGWQVAQVAVLLGRLSATYPRAAVCQFEVGMPVVNKQQGYIPVELAQSASAFAADQAAREMLGQRRKPTGALCIQFRRRMEHFLTNVDVGAIDGAKVSDFKSWPGRKIPRRTFPPRRGRKPR